MFEDVRADIKRATPGTAPGAFAVARAVINSGGLQAVLIYRLGRWIAGARRRVARLPAAILLAPLYVLLAAWVRLAYDVRLELSADIGPGVQVYHFGGIRVSHCRLGALCVLHQEVRLEPRGAGEDGPRLGNAVWVGPHARIVGGVSIGDRAIIAAGAVVRQDVPPDVVVVGDPARIMSSSMTNPALVLKL